jgi:CheY-like chemotaxis protein
MADIGGRRRCRRASREFALHLAAVAEEVDTDVEALALTERWRFGALLVDVLLPDMDGRELCRICSSSSGAKTGFWRLGVTTSTAAAGG